MSKIKGISVVLYDKVRTGTDPFGKPIFEESPVTVSNVLPSPATSDDVATEQSLSGRKVEYILGIPKGDTHDWREKKVSFFGQTFKTFGLPTEGIEENTPLLWNKKVKVERYE